MIRTVLLLSVAAILAGCQSIAGAGADAARPEVVLHEVRPGIWVHTSYYTFPNGDTFPSNGLIVREGNGLLLVDTAWGELSTVELLEQIEAKIGLPVLRAIVTHWHADRLAGADVLKQHGIEVLAHPMTRRLAIEGGSPVPDRVMEELAKPGGVEAAVTVGSVEVLYPGPAHSPDNLLVWVPAARVLFGGCAVRAQAADTMGNTAHADSAHWSEAIRLAQRRYPDAQWIVPGHGEVGGPELLVHTLDLLER